MKKNRHMYSPLKFIMGLIFFSGSQLSAQTPVTITNGSFETGNSSGWDPGVWVADWVGDAGTKDGTYAADIYGNPMADLYTQQTISVPNGTYKVTCLMMTNDDGDHSRTVTTTRLFANNNSTLWAAESYYQTADLNILRNTLGETLAFAGYDVANDGKFKTVNVFTTVTNGVLTFGIRTNGHNTSYPFTFQSPATVKSSGYVQLDNFTVFDVSNVATLSGITLSTGSLKSPFTSDQTTYLAVLPQGTTTVTPTVNSTISGVTVSGDGLVDVSSGSGVSAITVTALDGITTKTYTINYVVWSSTTTLKLHSYTFTDGANDTPAIGTNAINGTINNIASVSAGKLTLGGGYVSFDGAALNLNSYNGITLEYYIKPTMGANSGHWNWFSYFGSDWGGDCIMTGDGTWDRYRFTKNNGADGNIDVARTDDGLLHHIVTVMSAGKIKMYVDGVKIGEETASTTVIGTANAYLGRAFWDDPSWQGLVDEFNIYEGELSAEQITANYQAMANKNITGMEIASLSLYKNVTVRSGGAFTVTNPANVENMLIQSGGTLLDNGNLTSSNTTVQQYIPSGRNWYISSPVSNAISAVFDAANTSNLAVWYDEVHGSTTPWPTITDNTTSLSPVKGYIVNLAASDTLRFAGAINTGEKSITVSRTAGQTKEGFNLIGNPYPSYVSWDAAEKSNMETTMWYQTKNTAETPVYVFDTYNSVSQIGTSLNGEQVNCNIPPMQAFWVRVKASGDGSSTTGSVTFQNAMRSHKGSQTVGENTIPDVKLKAPAILNNPQKVLRLQVSNGVNKDEAIVLFNASASNGLDDYDSYKMSNNNDLIPEIYTKVGSNNLVINGLANIETNSIVPLGFKTGQTSDSFTIKAIQASNFESNAKIFIHDNELNSEQEITTGESYTFSSIPTTTDTRFSILFKSPSITTATNNNTVLSNIKISIISNNRIAISNPIGWDNTGFASVYNSVGQKLECASLNSSTTNLKTILLPGIYFVAIEMNGEKKVEKIIVK